MKKRKPTRRAQNKIGESSQRDLVTVDPPLEPASEVSRVRAVVVARSSLFTAELEEAIDLIARERVYRAYLDRLGRRLLPSPALPGDLLDA